MPTRSGGEDQEARHQVPAWVQCAEWSGKHSSCNSPQCLQSDLKRNYINNLTQLLMGLLGSRTAEVYNIDNYFTR